MSIIFEEALSGGNKGNFDIEVLGNGISYVGSEATMNVPVIDSLTYVACDSAIINSTPQIHIQFDFKLDSLTLGSTGRTVAFFSIIDGGQQALTLKLIDNAPANGRADTLSAIYQQSASTKWNSVATSLLSNDTYAKFDIFYQDQYSTKDPGQIRVLINDTEVINISLTDQHQTRRFIDIIAFGNYAGSNVAGARTMHFKDIKISASSAFEADTSNYYVDNVNGADVNTGTLASPLKNAGNISSLLLPGDTMTLIDNGEANPYRMVDGDLGAFDIRTVGTVSALVTISSYSGKACVTNAYGVGVGQRHQFNAAVNNGEYYVTLTGGGNPSIATPGFIALGLTGDDFSDLRRVFADSKVAGSLLDGEFGYGDIDGLGYNVVYYKPLASENITTLRCEILKPNTIIVLDTNYTLIKNLKPRMGQNGILDNGTTAGSAILGNDSGYNSIYGIQSNAGNALIELNESHNNQSHILGSSSEAGGGIALLAGSTNIAQGNYCHHNADDGMDVNGVGAYPKVYGNRLTHNGYNAFGDGSGIEVSSSVAGCDIENNVTHDNSTRGISTAHLNASTVKNNLMFNELYALWLGNNVGAAMAFSNNGYYNNTFDQNLQTGASYSSIDDITGQDPLLDSDDVATVDSPMVGAGDDQPGAAAWTIAANNQVFPNVNRDIGGTQSTHSPTHPMNT